MRLFSTFILLLLHVFTTVFAPIPPEEGTEDPSGLVWLEANEGNIEKIMNKNKLVDNICRCLKCNDAGSPMLGRLLSSGRCSVQLYTNEDPLMIRNHFQVLSNPKSLLLRWRPEVANDWLWGQQKVPVNGSIGEVPNDVYVARMKDPNDEGQAQKYGIAFRPKKKDFLLYKFAINDEPVARCNVSGGTSGDDTPNRRSKRAPEDDINGIQSFHRKQFNRMTISSQVKNLVFC